MHLTNTDIDLDGDHWRQGWRFEPTMENIDDEIFYSVPSSFFTLDRRIPKNIRDLFSEAEGCLKSNYLTGASACARKVVYEVSEKEGAEGDNYEDRIKSLKLKFDHVESTYFDTMLTIQQIASTKVHENAYDGWESKHLKIMLSALAEILHEIYVLPKLKSEKREKILQLKADLTKPNSDINE